MLGSSGFATFSHSLQLLTTCENFWEQSESRVYSYGGKSWEGKSLLQSNTIPSSALGSCSSTRPSSGPWWCLSAGYLGLLGSTDPSRGWPNPPACPPRVWGYGSPLCFSNLFALSALTQWASLAGGLGKCIYLSHVPPSISGTQEHAQEKTAQSRKRESLRLVIPWVKGVAGRWAVPSAELVLLPCSTLLHSLTGHFCRLLVC